MSDFFESLDLSHEQVSLLGRAVRIEGLMAHTGEADAARLLRQMAGPKPRWRPRPVAPALEGALPLASFPVADWERDGVVCVGPLFSADAMMRLTAAADHALERAFAASGMASRADWVARVSQLPNPGDWEPEFLGVESAPGLCAAAARALGVARAECVAAQVILKPPFAGAPLPWHTDRPTWGLDADVPGVTLWLALDPIEADSGGLWYQPGSHRGAAQPPRGLMPAVGEVLLHHGDVLHHSRPNRSARWRRAWVAVFAPVAEAERRPSLETHEAET